MSLLYKNPDDIEHERKSENTIGGLHIYLSEP